MNETNEGAVIASTDLRTIIALRMAVGLLGEQDNGNWWSSLWGTANADAFLTPIYGEKAAAARYHGLVEAARRVHDERIGVGRVFHLFRLPEMLERRLHDMITREYAAKGTLGPKGKAEELLSKLSSAAQGSDGPVRVGSASDLEGKNWVGVLAGHYLASFKAGRQTYPYFTEGQ